MKALASPRVLYGNSFSELVQIEVKMDWNDESDVGDFKFVTMCESSV